MGAPKAIGEFTEGLNEINASSGDVPVEGSRSSRLKGNTSSVYDMAALGSSKGDIWNWGMYDEEVAAEIEKLIPGFTDFETDGISEQLYFLALKDIPLGFSEYSEKSVLEVGCGSGEGLNFLSRLLGDGSNLVGLDLSPLAVKRANATLGRGDRLRYVQGDAEELPFEGAQFDVLINIESSHTYPDLRTFFEEAMRVLKPGGYLAHIDVFTRQRYELMTRLKRDLPGLDWIHERDISAEVRAGIRRRLAPGSHFRKTFADKRLPPLTRRIAEHSRTVIFGGVFAGYQDSGYIKLLRKLGVLPHGRHLPVESYRHHVAVKTA
ncbi:class I SAM-dependent methyltransferase [Amycolatopsis cihanbeyliensis]|uniref:Methyltransferase family protein n=1 Tax=Amycolatopsis cihanbeyliensis TaxID=1128664 RepID=A0A542DJN2_AMYCI|nr:class I SAM-dependent methyltransferase [Amycolatopsis cihanbeyliensis]TQJ03214.1 methyltransferase family protein [Amycolatopsis cihanbeyliensis]WCB87225.1 EfrMI [Amycolatopsis cihanbeyliensis]